MLGLYHEYSGTPALNFLIITSQRVLGGKNKKCMKNCVFLSLFLIGLSSSAQISENFSSEVTLGNEYSSNSVSGNHNSFEIGLQSPKPSGYLYSSPQFTRRTISTASSSETPTKFLITTSPFTLFSKWRFEKLTNRKITYGVRAEYFLLPIPSFALLPNSRFYPFSKDASGLYSELAVGPILYSPNIINGLNEEGYTDVSPIQTQVRVGLGIQWFTGKKNNIPIDINLSLNVDTFAHDFTEDIDDAEYTAPLPFFGAPGVLKLRFQTGFGR